MHTAQRGAVHRVPPRGRGLQLTLGGVERRQPHTGIAQDVVIHQGRCSLQEVAPSGRIGPHLLRPQGQEPLGSRTDHDHARVEGPRFRQVCGAGTQAVPEQRAQHARHQGDGTLRRHFGDDVAESGEDPHRGVQVQDGRSRLQQVREQPGADHPAKLLGRARQRQPGELDRVHPDVHRCQELGALPLVERVRMVHQQGDEPCAGVTGQKGVPKYPRGGDLVPGHDRAADQHRGGIGRVHPLGLGCVGGFGGPPGFVGVLRHGMGGTGVGGGLRRGRLVERFGGSPGVSHDPELTVER